MKNTKLKKRFRMSPMLVVLLGFLAVMSVGAFLLALPISNTLGTGEWLPFTHVIYWATNGVCGTGLTVKPTALIFSPFGQAVMFILIQFGGLGFMTFATMIFILIRKRITVKDRIAIQEALGLDEMKGVVRLVKNIAIMTGIIELAGAILLAPFFCVRNGPIGIWQAVFNSVSAFCNAGFDVNGTPSNPYGSLTDYHSNAGILIIISVLAILGAFGFPVINDALKCRFRWKKYRLHTKMVIIVQLSLMVVGTFFFLASEFNSLAMKDMNGGEKLLNSMFQSVMASSTAGFSSVNQTDLSSTGRIMTCVLMFIGASPCSTGGGIKTSTLAVLILMGICGLRGKDEITVAGRTISIKTGLRSVTVLFLATALVIFSAMIMSATDPNITQTIGSANINNDVGVYFFECITAFTTTGLSNGAAPYLSSGALYLQAVIMLIGRIGPMSVGMIFVRSEKNSITYPNANIMIG
ncbi:MAG: hypothetical protein J1F39_03795 [Clostridiales bacterium]|nr:hypothetical protein [Clostridiales bacterium]